MPCPSLETNKNISLRSIIEINGGEKSTHRGNSRSHMVTKFYVMHIPTSVREVMEVIISKAC